MPKQLKNPVIAVFLSSVFPGAGQIYNGQVGKGVVIFLVSWLVLPWIYGVIDAWMTAQKINSGHVPQEVSPAVAGILSFIFPGAGQMYLGQVGKGACILYSAWLLVPWLYGIFNAYTTAERVARGEEIVSPHPSPLAEAAAVIVPGLAAAVIGFALVGYTVWYTVFSGEDVYRQVFSVEQARAGVLTSPITLTHQDTTHHFKLEIVGENLDERSKMSYDFNSDSNGEDPKEQFGIPYDVILKSATGVTLWEVHGTTDKNYMRFPRDGFMVTRVTAKRFSLEQVGEYQAEIQIDVPSEAKDNVDHVAVIVVAKTETLQREVYASGVFVWCTVAFATLWYWRRTGHQTT